MVACLVIKVINVLLFPIQTYLIQVSFVLLAKVKLLLLSSYHRRLRMTTRSVRAVRGRQTSYSRLVHGSSQSYLGWVGWGQWWRWWLVSLREKATIGWSHVGRYRSTSRVRGEDTDDTRSLRLLGTQFWVWSSRNWSVVAADALIHPISGLICSSNKSDHQSHRCADVFLSITGR